MFAPATDSMLIGFRHFGLMTMHIWLLRLAIFAVIICLIEFPSALVDYFVAPHVMRLSNRFELLLFMRFASACGSVLVNAALMAFCVVYDARLAMCLGEWMAATELPSAERESRIGAPVGHAHVHMH
jgi:hypothetical protein